MRASVRIDGPDIAEAKRIPRDLLVTGTEDGEVLGSQSALVHGLSSILVAPVRLKGRLLGVLYLDSRIAKGIFTRDDVDILMAITSHVAVSLETARAAQLERAGQGDLAGWLAIHEEADPVRLGHDCPRCALLARLVVGPRRPSWPPISGSRRARPLP